MHHLAWDDLLNPEKTLLHTSLRNEQGHVCCYCERRITAGTSHIEHFRPRSKYPAQVFDYQNTHASCSPPNADASIGEIADSNRDQDGAKRKKPLIASTCGAHKGDLFDNALISPLESDCASFFRYFPNGEVQAAGHSESKRRAELTISLLNLNSRRLKDQRKERFDFVNLPDNTAEDIGRLRKSCEGPVADEEIEPFSSAILYYLSEL
jgi:uncharacterized protein (TIGR02646 family)